MDIFLFVMIGMLLILLVLIFCAWILSFCAKAILNNDDDEYEDEHQSFDKYI